MLGDSRNSANTMKGRNMFYRESRDNIIYRVNHIIGVNKFKHKRYNSTYIEKRFSLAKLNYAEEFFFLKVVIFSLTAVSCLIDI